MKIALVHLCSFGDCLYATLVARQIRRDFPNCELTWVIADRYASILEENPDIDVIHTIPISEFSQAQSGGWNIACRWVNDQLAAGLLDRAIFTQILPDNMLLYDGLIRSTVYRGYPNPVIGPHRPVVVLNSAEIDRVNSFISSLQIERFRHIFLFECGPRSNQSPMNPERAEQRAHRMAAQHPDLLLLLTSDRPLISASRQVVDASELSVRENAVLARYCTGLIGCSSGITWLTTSIGGKLLPMLQVLTKSTEPFRFASVAADFVRFELDASMVIEMADPDDDTILNCIQLWVSQSHIAARTRFNEPLTFTSAHAGQMFRFVRKHYGTRSSFRFLLKLLKQHRLRFPVQTLWYELTALQTDAVTEIRNRSLLRNDLRRTGLLPIIRKFLNRDPETGKPVN